MNWKSGLIICLSNQAKTICSTTALFQKEVKELRSMFQKNGYPKSYFNKIFNTFGAAVLRGMWPCEAAVFSAFDRFDCLSKLAV